MVPQLTGGAPRVGPVVEPGAVRRPVGNARRSFTMSDPLAGMYHCVVTHGGEGAPEAAPRPLRVLLVIKCLGVGGAERLLVDTVTNGDPEACSYEVAYVLDAEHALAAELAGAGIPVTSLGARSNADLRWMWRLRALVEAGDFDVVHFHLPYTAALGRLVVATIRGTRRTRRPAIVYTEHSLWNRMAVAIKGLNRATIGLDQALIVVSDAARDALPPTLRGRARVIVHGVDLAKAAQFTDQRDQVRSEVRAELGVPDGSLLVTTVANLRPEKGYDVLLDTVRRVADEGLDVRFVAVGRGPLEAEIHARHRELGLGDHLQLLGERDDVLRLLAGSDVFLLASWQEGLPVSLMEATSMGMPIIATAVGGVPQIITDGVDGLIVPPGEPDLLAGAVRRLASDPELRARLGTGAKERSAMFNVALASREIEDIYRTVVVSH